ncbi:hypothetical protein [Glycomyces sp. YM15]|uniref:hypothetical protein n=1 Tax=Glycomyces sp. YM15 TaxID=2800446 RepID=UPI001963B7E0|nr:hypothetical protein [Glycomyces sp. YM15]
MITGILTSAVIAALLTGTVNIGLGWRKSRTEERDRVRTVFAEAFAAYTEYREYPYVIRRRNADIPGDERVRISEMVRQTQQRINYYLAWTQSESPAVGKAYNELVTAARNTAGVAMKEAWKTPAITEDHEMNISTAVVNLTDLTKHEHNYAMAVHEHLLAFASWPVRVFRALRSSSRPEQVAPSSGQTAVAQAETL